MISWGFKPLADYHLQIIHINSIILQLRLFDNLLKTLLHFQASIYIVCKNWKNVSYGDGVEGPGTGSVSALFSESTFHSRENEEEL